MTVRRAAIGQGDSFAEMPATSGEAASLPVPRPGAPSGVAARTESGVVAGKFE
jgi:hypothetical protein